MSRKYLIAAALLAACPAAFAQAPGCSVELEGNDLLQYNLRNIDVSRSCRDFTITLKHVGRQARNVMGHNVIIAGTVDITGINDDGLKAGLDADYVKAGDPRVIAHSRLVGGGESTAVTFAVTKLGGAGPYSFFCSFPGHAALMKGTITLKP